MEIERKFIVSNDRWRAAVESSRLIVQAYIALDKDTSVRVRISDDIDARLTVKMGAVDITRHEFEYPIPIADAQALVEANRDRSIDKRRHLIPMGGFVWEVDVFAGSLEGLVVAEVELGSENDDPPLPGWLGREVTGDAEWSNAALATTGRPADIRP